MRESAFSIMELLLVVAILGIVALELITRSSGVVGEKKLELAASEVAAALRFANSEAVRTGVYHGARFSTADNRALVYRLDTSGSPPVEEYSVFHPVDKRLYRVELANGGFTQGVNISLSDFRFGGAATAYESVAFAATGMPISPVDLTLMDQGQVDLTDGQMTKSVTLAPVTGRVSVQ